MVKSLAFTFFTLAACIHNTSLCAAVSTAAPPLKTESVLGSSVCQDMWDKAEAGSNLKYGVDFIVDKKKIPLFTFMESGNIKLLGVKEFVTFKALLDSYDPDSKDEKFERDMKVMAFLDEIGQPDRPLEQAFKYLKESQLLPPGMDMIKFLGIIKGIWFDQYKTHDGILLSGFQHVFLGNLYKHPISSEVHYEGFHNWYRLYLEQMAKRIGEIKVGGFKAKTEPPYLTSLQFKWMDHTKVQPNDPTKLSSSSMFAGTSPGFDIALFSVCFLQYKGQKCKCHIGRSTIVIQSFDPTIAEIPVSDKVLTAYPFKVSEDPSRCVVEPQARTACGDLGVDMGGCLEKGCCFEGTGSPKCFYPKGHKCDVGIRKDCAPAFPGITRMECETNLSCCFDNSIKPSCFFGNA